MMERLTLSSIFVFFCVWMSVSAQKSSLKSECYECILPKAPGQKQNFADVVLRKGTIFYNVTSVKREVEQRYSQLMQFVRIRYLRDSLCADTLLNIYDIKELRISGLGPNGGTLATPVYPAREFYYTKEPLPLPTSFFELTPLLAISGSDKSQRSIGYGVPAFGGEAIVAPFGSLLGERLSLGIGGGIFLDENRHRYPVFAHLRFNFKGTTKLSHSIAVLPSPCKFRLRDTTNKVFFTFEPASSVPFSGDYVEKTGFETLDSTAFIGYKSVYESSDFRPFLFIEGGPVFNGNFAGAGANPSVNSEDYSQYFVGAGAGAPLPFADFITVSIGYRYMRLHVRTPCPSCPPTQSGDPNSFYFLNTNTTHNAVLKLGWRLQW